MNQLAKDYFDWLYERVLGIRDVSTRNNYTVLCDAMHRFPFKNLIPHDGNRIADGVALRDEFLKSYRRRFSEIDKIDLTMPDASMLEVLAALAVRADFMTDHGVYFWFDVFITNLKLKQFNDMGFLARDSAKVERKLRRFNDRRYFPDGDGGIFPLSDPAGDQRQIELWYQMGAYMTEHQLY
jgi:hypothetical protein